MIKAYWNFPFWMFMYAVFIWFITAKGGGEGGVQSLIWGAMLGAGAGIAACNLPLNGIVKKTGVVVLWWFTTFVSASLLFEGSFDKSREMMMINTLAGSPALLALMVWIFKRQKPLATEVRSNSSI